MILKIQYTYTMSLFRVTLFLSIAFVSTFLLQNTAYANSKYASIVVDAETGKVLRSRNANKRLYPASLTKIMTLYMTFDALSRGQIRLNERIRISRHAASMVPSKLHLPAGSSIKVEDAIYALVTKSANDVAVALAEKLGGSEWKFAKKMTSKARALGMRSTTFKNASGLPNKGQKSTARDMAILARALIYNHPQYYHYFSTKKFKYRGVNYKNHNKLLNSYDGMDGIKTGYIHASGFNLVASAVRNNRRLVAVVFGGRSSRSRNSHMAEIMDKGFVLARALPPTRMASKRVPKPSKKPDTMAVVMASLDASLSAKPSSKQKSEKAIVVARANTSVSIPLPPAKAIKRIDLDEVLGQGDVDVNATLRLETGLMAIAAHSGRMAQMNGVGEFGKEDMVGKKWAIQIGAYSSRKISQQAIKVASKSLPPELRAEMVATTKPLTTGSRTIYRARIGGFDELTAQKACAYLRNCMVIAP